MLKIVIVEDEDVIRDGLINYMDWNSIGYEFAGEASNGRQAIEVINRVNPDVLLTDIRMPFIDGLTLVEEVKKDHPDLYYIILSGHDEFEYARRALKAGVYEFLLKPIHIPHLKEILSKLKIAYEKRQSTRDELQKLKELERESKLQLKKKILGDILVDNVPVDEQSDFFTLLGNEFKESYFVVGVVEMQNLVMRTIESDYLELTEIDREFGVRIESFIENIDNSFLFKSSNCERIICLVAANSQILTSIIQQISINANNKQDELVSIVLFFGNIHKGLEGLIQSHMEGRTAWEKMNTKTWTNVLYPVNQDIDPINFTDFDTSTLIAEVKSGTKEGIDVELQLFENTLKIKGMTSHMFVIMIISNIFFQIIKLPEGMEEFPKERMENTTSYYQKIINQKDITGIFYYLKKVCYSINDIFAEVYSGKFGVVLKRAIEYINENYQKENLMLKDVAGYAYVSSSYLSIILKKEMGITFIEYLTKVRMEHAKKLLDETQMKHYEIAEACGYSNPTYFSSIFKKIYGVSPSTYLTTTRS